ncbi:DUF3152 domain-containing protein [Actinoplanes sp. NPDC051494]|uniref:DUF3152 domain-containing protein n=1 Tax=Actinoplanes sp. NPDC051494 TaxID=3363907 RepID=UPI0037BAD84B
MTTTSMFRLAAAALVATTLSACAPAPVPVPARVLVPRAVPVPPSARPSAPAPPAEISFPASGARRWTAAAAQTGPAAGTTGRTLRYRVLVERDIKGVRAAAFANDVAATLGDGRGWTAGGRWRFRRVALDRPYDFTVYLATPGTRDLLCADGPDGYTSCRKGDKVVLNAARWARGVPGYGAGLGTYRRYMVNHEVGHRLGHGHQRCPGAGEPAPVMQQQTLGLHGCEPNAWPYPGGSLYQGASGQYDDPLPPG